jgi:asparagine synthase (glutamine-hydrolysing)
VAFGFRRLAILDLTSSGHQPMISASGRYVIVFNGEVYNYMDLRAGLEKLNHVFRGTSDTEVMLAAFDQWGVEAAVPRFNGMFAFAVWDRSERCLQLGRDRVGIKPLYYGWAGSSFIFGSELKALRAHPEFKNGIDRDALALFLQYNYVPAPSSIYLGISKLPPASILTIHAASPDQTRLTEYWSAGEAAAIGLKNLNPGNEDEIMEELEEVIKRSIRERMVADVPLGAFLSGGIDSSMVVALMQAQSSQRVKTFTIGFEESGYNEALFAREIARRLGTEHTELTVSPAEALAVIPRLPALYDEPFADSSQIPTFLVAQMARKSVTVCLSGDGGDELFGGYNRYTWAPRIWKMTGWLPSGLRKTAGSLLEKANPFLEKQFSADNLGTKRGIPQLGEKLQKAGALLPLASREEIYRHLTQQWNDPYTVVLSSQPGHGQADRKSLPSTDFVSWMQWMDITGYLPDDILVKVDRASMGASLESRVPYLDDHRVIEFAWRIPADMKIRNGKGKWLLRKLLHRYVPEDLVERPKMGFSMPVGKWLCGDLLDWAEALLSETRLREDGFFDPKPIRQVWSEHRSGKRNQQDKLWGILMFQAWKEVYG